MVGFFTLHLIGYAGLLMLLLLIIGCAVARFIENLATSVPLMVVLIGLLVVLPCAAPLVPFVLAMVAIANAGLMLQIFHLIAGGVFSYGLLVCACVERGQPDSTIAIQSIGAGIFFALILTLTSRGRTVERTIYLLGCSPALPLLMLLPNPLLSDLAGQ